MSTRHGINKYMINIVLFIRWCSAPKFVTSTIVSRTRFCCHTELVSVSLKLAAQTHSPCCCFGNKFYGSPHEVFIAFYLPIELVYAQNKMSKETLSEWAIAVRFDSNKAVVCLNGKVLWMFVGFYNVAVS